MKDLTNENVAELASSALASMAFMILDPANGVEGTAMSHHASIAYSSEDEQSEVFVSASDGFLSELASSMLGVEIEEVSMEEEGLPALTELANVLAGEVTRALGAESARFDVGIPELIDDCPEPMSTREAVGCYLDSMGEMLRILVVRKEQGDS